MNHKKEVLKDSKGKGIPRTGEKSASKCDIPSGKQEQAAQSRAPSKIRAHSGIFFKVRMQTPAAISKTESRREKVIASRDSTMENEPRVANTGEEIPPTPVDNFESSKQPCDDCKDACRCSKSIKLLKAACSPTPSTKSKLPEAGKGCAKRSVVPSTSVNIRKVANDAVKEKKKASESNRQPACPEPKPQRNRELSKIRPPISVPKCKPTSLSEKRCEDVDVLQSATVTTTTSQRTSVSAVQPECVSDAEPPSSEPRDASDELSNTSAPAITYADKLASLYSVLSDLTFPDAVKPVSLSSNASEPVISDTDKLVAVSLNASEPAISDTDKLMSVSSIAFKPTLNNANKLVSGSLMNSSESALFNANKLMSGSSNSAGPTTSDADEHVVSSMISSEPSLLDADKLVSGSSDSAGPTISVADELVVSSVNSSKLTLMDTDNIVSVSTRNLSEPTLSHADKLVSGSSMDSSERALSDGDKLVPPHDASFPSSTSDLGNVVDPWSPSRPGFWPPSAPSYRIITKLDHPSSTTKSPATPKSQLWRAAHIVPPCLYESPQSSEIAKVPEKRSSSRISRIPTLQSNPVKDIKVSQKTCGNNSSSKIQKNLQQPVVKYSSSDKKAAAAKTICDIIEQKQMQKK